MIKHTERKHDLEGRRLLRKIAKGVGIDIGFGGRPITGDVITLDKDPKYEPHIIADMKDIPVEDESFDFVIASHILEHDDNTIDTLKEWKRILKKGGKLGIMVPHGEFVDPTDLGDAGLTHRMLFTERTLGNYLIFVGFREIDVVRLERPLSSLKTPVIIAFAEK